MTKPERPRIIHLDLNEYDDMTDAVPGVTFYGGHMMSEPGVDSVPYVEKSALDEALREVERLKEQLDDCSALHKTAKAQFLELRQLKAEVKRLKSDLRNTAGYELGRRAVEVTENALHACQNELTLERECNSVLREAAESVDSMVTLIRKSNGKNSNLLFDLDDAHKQLSQALAREAEIRGKK